MQIEDADALAALWRSGFCIYVEGKPGSLNWLHAAIPTPTIVDGRRLRIRTVILVFRTMSADAIVRDIHVYDGDTKIGDINEVNLSGDVGLAQFDIPDCPEVQTAIGISIGLSFGVESLAHGVSFTAAGVEFV
jgi:hypothetical protein